MIISCFTAYHRNGRLVESRQEILLNYLKGWFIIDLISVFPFDIVLNQKSLSEVAKLSRILKLFKMLR
jgi:hyperpolarization activated cyclic nucleotide-gated potassium channel 2